MGNLVQSAQSLDIKKGISVYTVTHFDVKGFDLRSSSLSNNFEGGMALRVDKSNIKSTNAYVYDENGKLEVPIVYSDFIGRLYHQNDDIESSSFKFVTEEGFSNFESAIRKTNIRDNVNDFYKNFSPEDYNMRVFGNYNPSRIPFDSKIGDEYSLNGHVLHADHGFLRDMSNDYAENLMYYTRKVSDAIGNNGLSSEGRYDYIGLIPTNLMETQSDADVITNHRDRNYTKEYPKDIVKIAESERNKYRLRNYRYNFDYFIEHIGPGQKISEGLGNKQYGDIERIFEVPYLMSTLGKFGIYESSKEDRNRLAEYGGNVYTYKKQYAIGPETEEDKEIEYFSFNENVSKFISKVTKHNEGSLRTKYNSNVYYREPDSDGSVPLTSSISFIPENNTPSSYSKLIEKTNNLFLNNRIGSLIGRFHTSKVTDYNGGDVDIGLDNDELFTAKNNKYGLSRGRNLLSKNAEKTSGYEDPYCRVWTAHHQYGKVSTLIRPFKGEDFKSTQGMYNESLRPKSSGGTFLANSSVLMDSGFVRISPTNDKDFYSEEKKANIKSYMFSIENLAWRDIHIESELSKEQQGPNGGRIMWFPPYNLKFTENINVDWNANKFIGRGEQIYTYTNTDRSGTLSFTLLIDHPSIINKWRGTAGSIDDENERENEILRFFAGCELLKGSCSNGINTDTEKNTSQSNNNPSYIGRTKKIALMLFFPNNFSAHYYGNIDEALNKLKTYECGGSGTWVEQDEDIENNVYGNNNIISKYNLNNNPTPEAEKRIRQLVFNNDESIEIYSFFNEHSGYTQLNSLIQNPNSEGGTIFGEIGKNIKIDIIEAKGDASSHGNETNNKILGDRRRDFVKSVVSKYCDSVNMTDFTLLDSSIIRMNDIGANRDINTLEAKISRCGYVVFNIKWDEETTTNDSVFENGNFIVNGQNYSNFSSNVSNTSERNIATIKETIPEDEYKYDNEYLYFAKIEKDKDFAYEKIVERIRYFNPAYHSITPEGFNSRLTFLQQCTRQGPTMDLSSGNINSKSKNYLQYAGNLSFGRSPYCVLRIGDFFHTKICITSISIDYDASSGVQWDLNPEGVGVQPMFANVNINFNFIKCFI